MSASSSFLVLPAATCNLTIDELYLVCKLRCTFKSTIVKQESTILLKFGFYANLEKLRQKFSILPVSIVPANEDFSADDQKALAAILTKYPDLFKNTPEEAPVEKEKKKKAPAASKSAKRKRKVSVSESDVNDDDS